MYSSYAVAAAVCSAVFPALASVAVVLRLRARRINSLRYATNDYIVLVALGLSIALCCIVLHGATNAGIGQVVGDMSLETIADFQKHIYFIAIVTHLAIGVIKLSVLSFYKSIFVTPKFRFAANITMGVVWAWILSSFLGQVFSAWPISDFWNVDGDYDMDYFAFITAFAAMDITLDLVILCLPLTVIRSLNMNKKRKILLAGVFWLGLFCVISASLRLYFLYMLNSNLDEYYTQFMDISTNSVIWCEIEPCTSIIAACLPTFGPLVKGRNSLLPFSKDVRSSVRNRTRPTSTNPEYAKWASPPDTSGGDIHLAERGWYLLQDGSNNTTCAGDVELGVPKACQLKSGEIRVERSFTSQVQPARADITP
ncbi:hypothetical protein MMC30_002400 [Trapelia coarctata]|nr:hypothetical protein [Trapelia coarctata]